MKLINPTDHDPTPAMVALLFAYIIAGLIIAGLWIYLCVLIGTVTTDALGWIVAASPTLLVIWKYGIDRG